MKLFPSIGAIAAAALPAPPPSPGILHSSGNIGTPASSLWNSEQFSWMWRPVVAKFDFVGHRGLARLVNCLAQPPTTPMSDNEAFHSLRMSAQWGLQRISSASERAYVDNDLRSLIIYLSGRCSPLHTAYGSVGQTRYLTLHYASEGSKSDCSLYTPLGGKHIGLLSGEAKGEIDAPYKGMCQAIQLACDFLYHQVHVQHVDVRDIAIPFVVVSGGTAQFGAVYSLEHDFYPVPVLLTPPMSLYQLDQMYPVLEGIVAYVKTIPRLQGRASSLTPTTPPLLSLDTDKYFFKPLQGFGQNVMLVHHHLHQLVALFDAMYSSEVLRDIVVYPVGFLGWPSSTVGDFLDCFAVDFRAKIGRNLVERVKVEIPSTLISVASDRSRESKRRRTTTDNTAPHILSDVNLPTGYPILVYPLLTEQDGWRLAGQSSCYGKAIEVSVPQHLRSSFFRKVEDAVKAMALAGVCHLDIRLSNVFFRVQKAEEGEEEEVFIKVIDFDFAYFMDQPLPNYFVSMVNETENAYPQHITVANAEWSQHMLDLLHRALGLEVDGG